MKLYQVTICIAMLTCALRYTSTPLSIRLAGSTVCSLQCVAYITGVGHHRVVGCTGETVLTICGSTRITTVNGWGGIGYTKGLKSEALICF